MISCTSRDEANLVAGTFARSAAPEAKTIVRTQSADYVEISREGRLDVDFVVSSELEAAAAFRRHRQPAAATPTPSPRAACRWSSSTCRPAGTLTW